MVGVNDPIITIVGPTASGKSDLAITVAKDFDAEIVCADSRTIYKGMDIGTSKPTKSQQAEVRHHQIDIVTPDQDYTVADFTRDAKRLIADIQSRHKRVIVVGGTGMYIDALLYDYGFRQPTGVEPSQMTKLSDPKLVALAQKLYPQDTKNFVFKNRRRLEQLLTRGPADNTDRNVIKLNAIIIGIAPPKEILQVRIGNRTQTMLNNGFVHEVKNLIARYGRLALFDETIGYHQVAQFLAGEIGQGKLPELINTATNQYAKRQLTWFRRNKSICWFDSTDKASEYLVKMLKN